jgi:hypothetical protein
MKGEEQVSNLTSAEKVHYVFCHGYARVRNGRNATHCVSQGKSEARIIGWDAS